MITESNGFGETTASPVSSGQAISGTQELVVTFPSLQTGNISRNTYLGTSSSGPFLLAASGTTASTVTFLAPPATNSYAIAPPTVNTTGFTYTDSNSNVHGKRLELIRSCKDGNLEDAFRYLRQVVYDFNHGNAMSFGGTISRLRDAHVVFAMLDTLCSEMGTLIDANAGTLGTTTDTIGNTKQEDLALRIEAITVCVDYADFLEVTLPFMRRAVDDLVVVTQPADSGPASCASAHDVRPSSRRRCMYTAAGSASGPPSMPGCGAAAVRLGAGHGRRHRPARQLPPNSPAPAARRKALRIDRVHCRGWHTWRRFVSTPRLIQTCEVPFLRDFPAGARIQLAGHGYMPCGYFQLWHAGATGYRDYPIHENGTAEGSDMLHAARFPRQYRELIPEIVGIQLETDTAADPVGVNWAGRRTAEFMLRADRTGDDGSKLTLDGRACLFRCIVKQNSAYRHLAS